ncbi:XFP C-terminal domain-containing protein, partial [Lipomyces starkeyi]
MGFRGSTQSKHSEIRHVMASCGDMATMESLAATALLRANLPGLKIRFDLFKLVPESGHAHGLSDREYSAIFTNDKPVIFNFHSYPWPVWRSIPSIPLNPSVEWKWTVRGNFAMEWIHEGY